MILEGRVALVTGGGRGIGAAVARALAREGAAVAVVARSLDQVEEVAEELRSGGARALAHACDVTREDQVEELAGWAARELGPVEILVNNAGVSSAAPLARTSLEEWNRLLSVNATGTFLCTRAFLPRMVERGWGRVVNVASVAGLSGARYISAYTASKHAQVGLTRAVAAEVAAKGVTVNAVCPGYVDTEMTGATLDRIVETTGRSREEALDALRTQNPQGRLIRPEEVAHAVLSLCHPDAGGINGQALVLDGGAFPG